MILVGVEEVTDATGVRGGFGCDNDGVPVAAAATWLAMGDKLRDIPMEERGRELEAVDMARSLETALTGLTASNALAASNSVSAEAGRGNVLRAFASEGSCFCAHKLSCVAACSGSPASRRCWTTRDIPCRLSCVTKHLGRV